MFAIWIEYIYKFEFCSKITDRLKRKPSFYRNILLAWKISLQSFLNPVSIVSSDRYEQSSEPDEAAWPNYYYY